MRLLAAAAAVNWATEALTTKHTHTHTHTHTHATSKLLIELAKQEGYTGDDEKSVNLPGEERESLFKVCQE